MPNPNSAADRGRCKHDSNYDFLFINRISYMLINLLGFNSVLFSGTGSSWITGLV